MMFLNKLQMVIIELISMAVMVVKRVDLVFDIGKEKFIMLIVVIILSLLITLSESEEKGC